MQQKIILLTGASRGIGKHTALDLAKRGHIVYATMRDPSDSTFSNENIHVKPLDVTDKRGILRVVDEIIVEQGRIDTVINNAGYGLFGPVELATEEEVFAQFNVNLFGVLRVIKAVLPYMRKQKSGHIINISSIAGIVGNIGLGVYGATKHALEALSASLAATVFPWNINVSVIEPGATNTEFAESLALCACINENHPYKSFTDKYVEKFTNIIHEGQPVEEVAALIANVVETENPDFRYQTSLQLEETAAKLIGDPKGNRWLQEQKEAFGDWFD